MNTFRIFLLMLCCLAPAWGETGAVLESFTYPHTKAARSAWKAMDQGPALSRKSEGLEFPLPFRSSKLDRVYWDKAVQLDLSSYSSFQLDLSCPEPVAMRSFAVYLKSGSGWFVWNKPLHASRRQTLMMPRAGFTTEGQPEGWHRIEAIRISPWRGADVNTTLTLHAFRAHHDSLLLVQGTLSVESGELRTAEIATRRISDWLSAAGLSHNRLTDDELLLTSLDRIHTVILSYHHVLPEVLRDRLIDFTERGGRLIVFFSRDAKLARAMGFRLEEKVEAKIPGRWSTMVFPDADARHLPAKIYQESWNVRPVYPERDDASILAYWLNAEGERQPEPAWVQSPQGYWMSHILVGGDQVNKQRLLLGLTAGNDAGMWASAARNMMQSISPAPEAKTFSEAAEWIHGKRNISSNPDETIGVLEASRRLYNRSLELYEQERYPDCVQDLYRARHLLTRAFSLIQPSRKGEHRGVWDHHGTGLYPGDWERTCRELKALGINQIYANLLWGGQAHYPNGPLPESDASRLLGDQTAAFTQAAQKYGMGAQVWMVLWKLHNAPEDWVLELRKQNRLQIDRNGAILPWLNPAHPENRAMTVAALKTVLERYPVDGIHLDYVRYPNINASYDLYTRSRLEEKLGQPIQNWPDDAAPGGIFHRAFRDFRVEQINLLVHDVHRMIEDIRPEVQFSAAVFGKYPECRESVAQDWKYWLDQGWIDYLTPMNYTSNPGRFREWTREQTRQHADPSRIIPGIGVTASESDLQPEDVIEQIRIARDLNTPGVVLFDLDPALRDEILPFLSIGVFRED